MSQQFLLSSKARSLTLATVARMSDDEARDTFKKIRWADNGGEPYCPKCGCVKVSAFATRPLWKCSGCKYQFSVTAGTIFADRKRPLRDYLLAIAIFANGAKGHSALQLSRDLGCQYKTAFVLVHKLREAIEAEQRTAKITGANPVEIDGCYFGHTNRAADKNAAERKRRVVVVIRERKGRTLPFVFRKETEGTAAVRAVVPFGATIHADEMSGWDKLSAYYDMRRVNHSVEFKSKAGACSNLAESYFSRLRRAEIGIHHRVNGIYLGRYSAEMAWREDFRRVSNGQQFVAMAASAAARADSQLRGYWQRYQSKNRTAQ